MDYRIVDDVVHCYVMAIKDLQAPESRLVEHNIAYCHLFTVADEYASRTFAIVVHNPTEASGSIILAHLPIFVPKYFSLIGNIIPKR